MEKGSKKWTGLAVIIIAAIFMEALLGIQYNYSRAQLEDELERSSLMDLITSSLRIQRVLSTAEVAICSQVPHAEQHLHDPAYLQNLICSLVDNDEDDLIGAAVAFTPHYFPQYGYWCELYARQEPDTIVVEQIGSPKHDYFQHDFFITCMRGDTLNWTKPYYDGEGAQATVTSYVVPLREKGEPVGVLCIDLRTKWINAVVNHFHPHPSSFSMVLTEEGELIAAPADSVVSPRLVNQIVALFNDSTVERQTVGRGRITRLKFYDEEKKEHGRVYYARKSEAPHWQMMLVCYDKEAFGKLEHLRSYMFVFAIIGLAVLALIVWLFVRSNRKLQTSRLTQERLNGELRVAQNIQKQMLPVADSIHRDDIQICGMLLPAREVGGDLYDYFVRDEKLVFCIGDVSGKGIPAAMLMAQTLSLLRSKAAHDNNPANILKTVNTVLCNGNEANMFVTLFVGVLDLPTGMLRYCNAGHCRPIVVGGERLEISELDDAPNMPVGVFEDTTYVAHEYHLPANSTLFLYTDGLTEARDINRRFFGMERLKKGLAVSGLAVSGLEANGLAVRELIDHMAAAVQQFAQGAEQSDDLTMLAFRYTPQEENDILCERLTLSNDVQQVKQVGTFIKDIGARLGMDSKTTGEIRLAIEEAVVNVIHYAYPSGSTGNLITVDAKADTRTLTLILTDSGSAFDPTEVQEVDTGLSAEERPIGGLGIHLIRQLSDSINYERENGKNILTIKKHYEHNS